MGNMLDAVERYCRIRTGGLPLTWQRAVSKVWLQSLWSPVSSQQSAETWGGGSDCGLFLAALLEGQAQSIMVSGYKSRCPLL